MFSKYLEKRERETEMLKTLNKYTDIIFLIWNTKVRNI